MNPVIPFKLLSSMLQCSDVQGVEVAGVVCLTNATKHIARRDYTVVDMAAQEVDCLGIRLLSLILLRDNVNLRHFARSPHPTEPITVCFVVRVISRKGPVSHV